MFWNINSIFTIYLYIVYFSLDSMIHSYTGYPKNMPLSDMQALYMPYTVYMPYTYIEVGHVFWTPCI